MQLQLLATLYTLLVMPGWFPAVSAQDAMGPGRPIPPRMLQRQPTDEVANAFPVEPYRSDPRAAPYIVRLRSGGFVYGWPEHVGDRIVVHGPQGQVDSFRQDQIE